MTVSYADARRIARPSPRSHEQGIPAAAESAWTFGFIDLAGFTALTDAHGDREAVAVVDRFETIVIESLTADDQLVKTIGDAVMLRFASMTTAIAGTRRIFAQCASGAGFPAARAGLHHGPAVARGQDWFGATINIAARVAAYGRVGQLLATRAVAETARRAGTGVTALGPVHLRNIVAPVELYDIDVGATGTMSTRCAGCRSPAPTRPARCDMAAATIGSAAPPAARNSRRAPTATSPRIKGSQRLCPACRELKPRSVAAGPGGR